MIVDSLKMRGFIGYRDECLLDFSGRNPIGIVGANECLRGDTPVYDPVDGTTRSVKERYALGKPFHVYAMSDRGPVVAGACPPIMRQKEAMVETTMPDGTKFCTTPAHRVLTTVGWKSVAACAPHLSSSSQLLSTSGIYLKAHALDATRWIGTAQDSPGDCHHADRLCGEQLHFVSDNDRPFSPLLAGALLCIRRYLSLGGLGSLLTSTHSCLLSSPLSTCHSYLTDYNHAHEIQLRSALIRFALSYTPGCNDHKSHGLNLNLDTNWQVPQRAGVVSEVVGLRSQPIVSLKKPSRYSIPAWSLCAVVSALLRKVGVLLSSCPVSTFDASHSSTFNRPYYTEKVPISTNQVRSEEYYDFHVPIYNNYWACGVWHHNSGKSSILRAITYALFGSVPTPQGTIQAAQLINTDSDSMMVQVATTLPDGSQLSIERGRTSKNESVLRASGIGNAKPTKVQEHIAECLGVTYEDFVSLSYFVQGDIHEFMSSNKRAYFQRWTEGLKRWKGYEEGAASSLKQVERSLQTLTSQLEVAKLTLSQATERKATVRQLRARALDARKKAQLASGQVEALTELLGASESHEAVKQLYDSTIAEQRGIANRLSGLEVNLKQVKREIGQISRGMCPLLSIDCSKLKKAGSDERKRLNVRYRELTQVREDVAERNAKLELARKDTGTKLKKFNAPVGRLKAQLADAKHDLNDANRELRRLLDAKVRAEVALDAVVEARKASKLLKLQIESQETMLRRWQFLRFMCGKSGVPATIIEGELEHVEDRCNWVLDRLDYPKRIKFSGYRELAGFERVCGVCGGESWRAGKCKGCDADRPRKRRDEPTVTVLDGSVERPFALESGGAQVLQSFAVRLSSGLFVASMTGVPMRMVMLDEIFSFLDSVNRQKLMSLVVDKLATEFGLRQQLIVSHQDDVINVVDNMIQVRREKGTAIASWQ